MYTNEVGPFLLVLQDREPREFRNLRLCRLQYIYSVI